MGFHYKILSNQNIPIINTNLDYVLPDESNNKLEKIHEFYVRFLKGNYDQEIENSLNFFISSFVHKICIGEDIGNHDIKCIEQIVTSFKQEIKKVEQKDQEKKETIQVLQAIKKIQEFSNENASFDKTLFGKIFLVEDVIKDTHQILMDGLTKRTNDYRNNVSMTKRYNNEVHFYPDHRIVPNLMPGFFDVYNNLVLCVSKIDDQSQMFVEKIFKLAAWLLFHFVNFHPFQDGNGRLSRILCNHVLCAISPFPLTPFSKKQTKQKYIEAIESCRYSESHQPIELTAMLVDDYYSNIEEFFKRSNKIQDFEPKK